jgi:glycosyltransferase involved in cell wall biosynthesis
VIIPIKDERENLVPLVEQLLGVLESREESRAASFEILFVDDGSTDGSPALLAQLAAQHASVKTIYFDKNYGKTAALDAGFKRAQGDVIVIMDGDLQTHAADIATLLQKIARYDVVCGRRMVRQDHIIRKISSRIANAVRAAVIGDGMHDTGCGFMLFRRHVVGSFPLFEGMHRFFPALALMHGFTVTEEPVRHYPRVHGVSKYGIGNRLFKSLYDMMAVRWMQSRRLRYRFRTGATPSEAPSPSSNPGPASPRL